MLTCVNKAGIAVQELVLEQLAAAEAVLTQDEREMGVLLMDLGGGTTDYAVFLEGNVVHTNVLPVGAGHFTSDISVVLRTPMEDAERIKKRYGCALSSLVTEDDPIEVPTVGGRAPKILSKQELTGILEPRAAEIAKLVYRDLEKVGLEKEIRSGVVSWAAARRWTAWSRWSSRSSTSRRAKACRAAWADCPTRWPVRSGRRRPACCCGGSAIGREGAANARARVWRRSPTRSSSGSRGCVTLHRILIEIRQYRKLLLFRETVNDHI